MYYPIKGKSLNLSTYISNIKLKIKIPRYERKTSSSRFCIQASFTTWQGNDTMKKDSDFSDYQKPDTCQQFRWHVTIPTAEEDHTTPA